MTTLFEGVSDVLDRLGDLDNDIWSRDEIALYFKDGYDTFCRRTKVLFDTVVIENLPRTGNWQTDLEKYLAEQKPGWGLTDEPFHMTADHERNLGVGGAYGGSYSGPSAVTSPGDRSHVGVTDGAGEDIPATVTGGRLPQSMVEVLRVAYDNRNLQGISSQQMRVIDPNYETRSGDPQWYIQDKDGLYYIRMVPAAQGDAVYDTVDGSWGTMTKVSNPVLTHHWTMDEASGDRLDSVGAYTLSEQGVAVLNEAGQIGNASIHTAAANNQLEGVNADVVPTSGPFTLSFWFKMGATNGNSQVVLHLGSGATAGTRRLIFSVPNTRTSIVQGVYSIDSGAAFTLSHTITEGAYYLYAVRRANGDLWSLALWDGTVWTEVAHATPIVLAPLVDPLAIGAYSMGTLPANVSVDSIKIWSDWLSNADVLLRQTANTLDEDGPGSAIPTVVTTEVSGYNTGGYGILRHRTDMFPSGGPWGTPTQVHPDDLNIKVEMNRLGRDLASYPSELPSAYDKYVTYWAMSRALRRAGPGQDIELAEHYAQRFEMGVSRLTSKKNKIQPERIGSFGEGGRVEPFGLGMPQAPYPYGPAS